MYISQNFASRRRRDCGRDWNHQGHQNWLAHPAWCALCAGMSRVSESLMYSTAWWRMYILTPYTPSLIRRGALCVQVWTGCQKVKCILLHGVVCIFSHPTHTRASVEACCVCRCEQGVRKSNTSRCMVSYVYSHTLHPLCVQELLWRTPWNQSANFVQAYDHRLQLNLSTGRPCMMNQVYV